MDAFSPIQQIDFPVATAPFAFMEWANMLCLGSEVAEQQELVGATVNKSVFLLQDAYASVFCQKIFKMTQDGAMICGFAAEVAL